MKRLIKSWFKLEQRDHLPQLKREIHNEFTVLDLDTEAEQLLLLGVAPDPQSAKDLLRKYNAATAVELLAKIPKKRPDWRRRIRSWLLAFEGSRHSDPWPTMMRERDYNDYL